MRDLLGQLLPCFTTPLVNIGCDETFDVGFGRSKEEVQRRGKGAVYGEFVGKVAEAARAHGKRPMFWGDIALSHPEALKDLPADLIALAWGYEPDSDFERWCAMLAGRETWVCPGTSSWRSIFGRTSERRENINAAAAAGERHKAAGFLVCDWGDTGHHQQWPVAMQGISHAAQAAWNAGDPEPDLRAVSLHGHEDSTLGAAPWLEKIGDADLALRAVAQPLSRPGVAGRLRNQSALFIDMHTPLATGLDVGTPAMWERALERVAELRDGLPAVGSSNSSRP